MRVLKHRQMQIYFQKLLCLPTASVLPIGGSGDFGTSPFFGQHSDRPLLSQIITWGAGRGCTIGVQKIAFRSTLLAVKLRASQLLPNGM